MFKVGSFIKWKGKDDGERIEYVGQFREMNEETVIFDTDQGTMGVHKDDGSFTVTKKPVGWSTRPVAPPHPKSVVVVPKQRKKRASNGPTKLDRVVDLLKENKDLISNRKEAINKIVEVIGMTPAGASTYFSNAKKRLT